MQSEIHLLCHEKLDTTSWVLPPKRQGREFPGVLVVRIQCLHHCSLGLIPGQGAEIPTSSCCMLVAKNKKETTKKTPL